MTDYFAFFGLAPSPTLDEAALKKSYYANSRKFHPDFHTLSETEAQEDALEKSTLNNRAYKTLLDPDTRLRHLLALRGALGAEGENQVPQDFLMEIMEVNEALMELEFEDDPAVRQKVLGLIDQLEADLERDAAVTLAAYNNDSAGDTELATLRDYYLKRRYLLRLKAKV